MEGEEGMNCKTCIHDGIEKNGGRDVHVCLNDRLEELVMNDLMIWIGTQKWTPDGWAPDATTTCPEFKPRKGAS